MKDFIKFVKDVWMEGGAAGKMFMIVVFSACIIIPITIVYMITVESPKRAAMAVACESKGGTIITDRHDKKICLNPNAIIK